MEAEVDNSSPPDLDPVSGDTFNDLQNYKRPWGEERVGNNTGNVNTSSIIMRNGDDIMSSSCVGGGGDTEASLKWDSEPLRLIVCIHILASVAKVGRVIGRKGEILRDLRKKYNCDIIISDHNYDYRIISLTGHYKFLSECLTAIYEKLEYGKPIQLHAMILVPEPVCGYIIGKFGNGLKQLRKDFDVKFVIDRKIVKWKRKADVLGFFDNVIACINKIIYLYTLSHYDTVNKTNEASNNTNNLGINNSPSINSYTYTSNEPSNEDKKAAYDLGPLKKQKIPDEITSELSAKTIQEIVYELSPDDIEVHMYLPMEYIARIIGTKGKTIELIREISGANVIVKEDFMANSNIIFPNGENPALKKKICSRLILIKGSPKSCRTVRQIIGSVIVRGNINFTYSDYPINTIL